MIRGEKIRRTITIMKVKNEVPTVIAVDGRTYILQLGDQYKPKEVKRC